MFPSALPASAARFLHSPTHPVLFLLHHQAQIRPVEMTDKERVTFEVPDPFYTYGASKFYAPLPSFLTSHF